MYSSTRFGGSAPSTSDQACAGVSRSGLLLRTLLTAVLTGYGFSTGGGTDAISSRTESGSVIWGQARHPAWRPAGPGGCGRGSPRSVWDPAVAMEAMDLCRTLNAQRPRRRRHYLHAVTGKPLVDPCRSQLPLWTRVRTKRHSEVGASR